MLADQRTRQSPASDYPLENSPLDPSGTYEKLFFARKSQHGYGAGRMQTPAEFCFWILNGAPALNSFVALKCVQRLDHLNGLRRYSALGVTANHDSK